jgi:hypothetical protein
MIDNNGSEHESGVRSAPIKENEKRKRSRESIILYRCSEAEIQPETRLHNISIGSKNM